MTKEEFLLALRSKLTGEIPAQEIERNLHYYENYIQDAIRQGKTEAEVLEELGSPLLIAKTIAEASQAAEKQTYDTFLGEGYENRKERSGQFRIFSMPRWMSWIILVLILVLALTVLRIVIPVLVPVILVCIILSWFRNR